MTFAFITPPAGGFRPSKPGPKPDPHRVAHAAELRRRGLTFAAIAKALGTSSGTARNYVLRWSRSRP